MHLRDDALEMAPELTRLRHALHAEPEIGLDNPRTQAKILAAIDGLPLEVSVGTGITSVTAVLRGTHPDRPGHDAPVMLLRADMDALPVQEKVDLDFRSQVDGVMHACGHDLHTAMLSGAARLLAAHRDHLRGDVVFMFQPGEEGSDGASVMVAEGVLDAAGKRADAAFALHVLSARLPRAAFASRPGPVMAAGDMMRVTVLGSGGHGSQPHLAKDPVTVAAEMVLGLQTMVTRRFDVFDPVVLTIGSLHAGTAPNVIPETASFAGTIRSWSGRAREAMCTAVPELLKGIAQAHGVAVDVEIVARYPVTVTDPGETAFVEATIAEVFGEDRYVPMANPGSGSEDFSRVLDAVPGNFAYLGATPDDVDPHGAPSNHSPYARFDDCVLPDGAALHAELAVRRLAALADEQA